MSGTCATCLHWTDITSQYENAGVHPDISYYDENDELVYLPAPGRWGWCKKVDELGPSSKSSQFYVIDGSDYHAALHTRETFGCTEHETGENSE